MYRSILACSLLALLSAFQAPGPDKVRRAPGQPMRFRQEQRRSRHARQAARQKLGRGR